MSCGRSSSRSCGLRRVDGGGRGLEGICWRFRTGSPWRDRPADFGAWQSVWERHRRWSADGSYERMFAAVKESISANDIELESLLSVDSNSPIGGSSQLRV
ncbi:transposase [Pseudarthrobacter sp. H3Y2-7]|uniref:transposase n=1 Tax=Pseudarthrobacter naphthalenicus TaxID=3031328 RepID=UPI0023B1D7AC|nr:transposase [Pseudarthrobacter sp. H3Y2-7]MDE8671000.1 transposase [Pseudarthrobacter sp. H3Y2-7]